MFSNECDFFLNIWLHSIVHETEDWTTLIMTCGLSLPCLCMSATLNLAICLYKIKTFKTVGPGKCKLFHTSLSWIKFNEMQRSNVPPNPKIFLEMQRSNVPFWTLLLNTFFTKHLLISLNSSITEFSVI